jgi:hypothetical protein
MNFSARPEHTDFSRWCWGLALAGAGEFEPPHGGIKIRLKILILQTSFRKIPSKPSAKYQ